MGTSLAIDKKTGQRGMVLAYEIPFSFFGNGIIRWDVMNAIFQSLTTCTLIIKQVLQKYSDSCIFNWHSKFANCLTCLKVDVLPYLYMSVLTNVLRNPLPLKNGQMRLQNHFLQFPQKILLF